MGWKRAFSNDLKEKDSFVARMRGESAWIRHGNAVEQIRVDNQLVYQMDIQSQRCAIDHDAFASILAATRSLPRIGK